MEVDILNDILTRTISNLFVNKRKHMFYLSEDDGEKQEIFQEEPLNQINQNNQALNKNLHNQNNLNNNQSEQTKKNIIEKIINNNNKNNIQKNIKQNNQNNQNQEITSPKVWCATIGKKKYEEALHRLQINERMIASKTYINEMNLERLTNEKARVKQELKKYDEDFYQIFKTKPTKENKEIMKPLYYYYQKLKLAITKKSEEDSTTSETIIKNDMQNNNINNNNNNHHHINTQSIRPSMITENDSMLTHEGINSELVSNISESNRQSKYSQMNNNSYHINMHNKGNINNNNVLHRKANSGGWTVSSNPKEKIEDFNLNRNQQKRSLSKEEINALEQEYFSIKKEQNNLTQMLRNYQNEFQKTNNRKVKWTKDIRPVEKEYNKYKANKERIKQIKELFGHIENNNK